MKRRNLLASLGGIIGVALAGELLPKESVAAETPNVSATIHGTAVGTLQSSSVSALGGTNGRITSLVPGANGVITQSQARTALNLDVSNPVSGVAPATNDPWQESLDNFWGPQHSITMTPKNLDGRMTALLGDHAAEFPLLATLTRTPTSQVGVMFTQRVSYTPDSHGEFKRDITWIRHLDYRTGVSQAKLNTVNAARQQAGEAPLTYQEMVDRTEEEGILGVLRRVEWALLHADGDTYDEGGAEQNPRTIYRGLLARATPSTLINPDWSNPQTYQALAAELRQKGKFLNIGAAGKLLVPSWLPERLGKSQMVTDFGTFHLLPSPYLHDDLLYYPTEQHRLRLAQMLPLFSMPLAIVSTTIDSFYLLHHAPVVQSPEILLRVTVRPPSDVPTPTFAPPPYSRFMDGTPVPERGTPS